MKIKKFITVFFISFFVTGILFAQENQVIKGFSFSGNKKTRTEYLNELLSDFVGKPCIPEVLEKVETVLRIDGLFSEIKTEAQEDGTVKVDVKEKLYFIPVPMASYSSNGFMGGAFLMNTNSFGRKYTMVAGGMFSQSMINIVGVFSKPPRPRKFPGFSLTGSFTRTKEEYATIGNCDFLDFTGTRFATNAGIQIPLKHGFSLNLGAKYLYFGFDNNFHDTINLFAFKPSINWGKPGWNGTFVTMNSMRLQGEVGYTTTNELYEEAALSINLQHCLAQNLRLYMINDYSLQHQVPYPLLQTRGSVSSTIISSDFHSPKMFNTAGGLELAFARTKMFTLSLYGQYEAITAENYDKAFVFNHGFNFGTRVYMSKISMPAFSMGFAYNITEKLPLFSINMGASF